MPLRDLSRRIEPGMPTYPGDPPVELESHATMGRDGYRVTAIGMGSHAGTHVDAPSHTEPDGATIDDLPPDAFEFDARLVAPPVGPREPIRRADLPDPDGADLLVLDTGWGDRWGTPAYRDHPYLDADAAAWCAERGLSVGVDALGVDPTPSDRAGDEEPDGVPAHRALLGAGQVIVENLTGLGGLPERFELRAYPLALAGGDGAPVRAVARV